MGLRETIQRADLIGLTDQQTLDALNATVVVATDSTAYTWAGLGEKLVANGLDPAIVMNARPLVQAITPGGITLDGVLSSGGFDLSSAINRALIASAGVTAPPDAVALLTAMLSIGITNGPRWTTSTNGISTQPTLSEIADARESITDQNDKCRLMNEVINPQATDPGITLATMKSNIANWSA